MVAEVATSSACALSAFTSTLPRELPPPRAPGLGESPGRGEGRVLGVSTAAGSRHRQAGGLPTRVSGAALSHTSRVVSASLSNVSLRLGAFNLGWTGTFKVRSHGKSPSAVKTKQNYEPLWIKYAPSQKKMVHPK